jgi:hypothetical protein
MESRGQEQVGLRLPRCIGVAFDVEASLADATARAADIPGEILLLLGSAREARDWRSREQVNLVLPHLQSALHLYVCAVQLLLECAQHAITSCLCSRL